VGKGDRVSIYMPNTVEAIAVMLACARLGAIHSVVFAGFSEGALRTRISDAGAERAYPMPGLRWSLPQATLSEGAGR